MPLLFGAARVPALGMMAVLCATSACDIWGSPGFGAYSVLVSLGDTAEISVPDSAGVSQTFSVSIETFGGGCVVAPIRTDLEVQDTVARIFPWDFDSGKSDCPDTLMFLHHEVQLSFTRPGTAIIDIVGREDTGHGVNVIQIERQVGIRPGAAH